MVRAMMGTADWALPLSHRASNVVGVRGADMAQSKKLQRRLAALPSTNHFKSPFSPFRLDSTSYRLLGLTSSTCGDLISFNAARLQHQKAVSSSQELDLAVPSPLLLVATYRSCRLCEYSYNLATPAQADLLAVQVASNPTPLPATSPGEQGARLLHEQGHRELCGQGIYCTHLLLVLYRRADADHFARRLAHLTQAPDQLWQGRSEQGREGGGREAAEGRQLCEWSCLRLSRRSHWLTSRWLRTATHRAPDSALSPSARPPRATLHCRIQPEDGARV